MDSVTLSKRIRIDSLKMINAAKASHIGSVFSIADIVAVLYADILNVDPANPDDEERDRFILGKGHAGAAIYAVLAETGFIPKESLGQYYTNGSVLSGHVSSKGVPGVELSTGSLGHGSSVAAGMALYAKIKKQRYRVYCIIGDGESEEGSVYEMALFAKKNGLNNLTIIIDNNGLQAMGRCTDVVGDVDMVGIWTAFGWDVFEIDGHDHAALKETLSKETENPKVIIAKTIKGKGVSFMEGDNIWHYRPPEGQQYEDALSELENGS